MTAHTISASTEVPLKAPLNARDLRFRFGFGTLEVLVALALWSFVLVGLTGLFMVALSAGTTAETSTVAANLARARLEEIRTMAPAEIIEAGDATDVEQVPPRAGRSYTVHTAVDASHPGFVDVTVTVTWQVPYAPGCLGGQRGGCAGMVLTQTRTLQTRIREP